MSPMIQFEIHASDPKVLVSFYSDLFGWRFEKLEGAQFWRISTGTEMDGGLIPRKGPAPIDGNPVNAFICTIGVESVDTVLARTAELGGSVAVPATEIPGAGRLGYIKDPDGNLVGVMQPERAV